MADTEVLSEAVPVDDVPNGGEEDDDDEEPDRTPDQERIAELEAFLLAEHAKVADLKQQLAAALASGGGGGGSSDSFGGGEVPPAPDAPPAPAAPPAPSAPSAPPPPPTLKTVSLAPAGANTDGRSALLASIQA